MPSCKHCGAQSTGDKLCENCRMKCEASASSTQKKSRSIRWRDAWVAVLLSVVIVTLGTGCEKKSVTPEVLEEPQGVVDPIEDEPIEEEGISKLKEELVGDVKSGLETVKEEPTLIYRDLDILKGLANGGLMGSLHLGSTKQELISKIGPANVEYEREGELRLDYPDATYCFSPNNGLVYSVILLLNDETTADFEQIKHNFDDEPNLQTESGVDELGDYYLSYGTEDSNITFYSLNETGQPIFKVDYTMISIYFADITAIQTKAPKHPGAIEPIILQIRKEYYAINEQLPSMKKEVDAAARQVHRNSEGIVRKVIEQTPEQSVEYYYDSNEDIMFIFQYKGTVENRFYFSDNQLIRWIDPNRITIDYDAGQSSASYKKWEDHWLELAY